MKVQIAPATGELIAAKSLHLNTIKDPLTVLPDLVELPEGVNAEDVCICSVSVQAMADNGYFITFEVRKTDKLQASYKSWS